MNGIERAQMGALFESIRQRRSIRLFTKRPISSEVIQLLLRAAHWAPSAHNRQPWRFVVVTDEHFKRSLADRMAQRLLEDLRADGVSKEVATHDADRSRARINGAPVVIVMCLTMVDMDTYPDPSRQPLEYIMAAQSVAMAGQNLMLMAHAAGLATCWMCGPLFCPDTVSDALSLPRDFQPQGLILLGHPAEKREKPREPLETRVLYR